MQTQQSRFYSTFISTKACGMDTIMIKACAVDTAAVAGAAAESIIVSTADLTTVTSSTMRQSSGQAVQRDIGSAKYLVVGRLMTSVYFVTDFLNSNLIASLFSSSLIFFTVQPSVIKLHSGSPVLKYVSSSLLLQLLIVIFISFCKSIDGADILQLKVIEASSMSLLNSELERLMLQMLMQRLCSFRICSSGQTVHVFVLLGPQRTQLLPQIWHVPSTTLLVSSLQSTHLFVDSNWNRPVLQVKQLFGSVSHVSQVESQVVQKPLLLKNSPTQQVLHIKVSGSNPWP